MPSDSLSAADGRWPSILQALGGLHPDQLEDRHQPCPSCMAQGMGSPPGGDDRYRWDGDDGPGSWYCSHCGGKDRDGGGGTGIGLLMRIKGWDFKTAARAVEAHLGLPSSLPPSMPSRPRTAKRPARIPDKPPADAPPPPLDGATAQWCYRDASGDQLFWIQRVPRPGVDTKGKPKKLFIHRTWIDGKWHRPSKRDAFTSEWPSPRPLYRLDQLALRPKAGVLLTEGEKSADAAATFFPRAVVLSWPNGGKAIWHIDLAPLAGRSITLWPDNDDEGRQAMASLAPLLLQAGATSVRIVTPPDDRPPGWDLADADDWTATDANQWIMAHRSEPITLPEPEAQPEITAPSRQVATETPPPKPIPTSRPFSCLGLDNEGGCFYQPFSTGQVVRLTRANHTGTNLVAIAPLAYWEALYPSKAGVNWTAAASDLQQEQAATGLFDPGKIRGRGAWWDCQRSLLHLGDRIIVDGITRPVTNFTDTQFFYQRGPALAGPGAATPLRDDEALKILLIASRFRWDVPASAHLLAGWIVLAPICGVLAWRPHIWLTAAAGSGKSEVLSRFIQPLLGDIVLNVVGNTTEPFIRQSLRSDALPVVMDEAESNTKADALRIQSVLALARFSSSESNAIIGKGSAAGAGAEQRFRIRSMFLLSSISTALKQGADRRRFAQLTLRGQSSDISEVERQAHWVQLERDLDSTITPEIGRRLIARSVQLVPMIRESITVFRHAAAQHFGSQAMGDQYGTLLAGAWALQSSVPPTPEQAASFMAPIDWSSYTESTEIPDERRCLDHILQHQLRVESSERVHTRTCFELIQIAKSSFEEPAEPISTRAAIAALGRHGLKVEDGRLLVSNTATALATILSDTAWANSWPTILARLPGSDRPGATRFVGLGITRAVGVVIPA